VATFFVLAFGITWLVWVPRAAAAQGLLAADWAVAAGQVWTYMPALAALLAAALTGGRAAVGDLGARLVRWRVGWRWYAVVLAGPPAFALVVAGAYAALGGSWSAVETISPAASYRPHIEGDIAGNVTVSYTHDTGGGGRQFFAVHRPDSGPWGTQTPLSGSVGDFVSDLVVAPNSGQATVLWGDLSGPMVARTLASGSWGAPATISGGAGGRLDLDELDRRRAEAVNAVVAGDRVEIDRDGAALHGHGPPRPHQGLPPKRIT
jgi:hypothetical protein